MQSKRQSTDRPPLSSSLTEANSRSQTTLSRVGLLVKHLRKRPLLWDTMTTTVWSSLGKGVGFLIPLFIGAWFGVTTETDAFFFAYGIVLFLSGMFSPVVASVMVPYVAELRSAQRDVGELVGKILGFGTVIFGALTLLLVLASKPLMIRFTAFDSDTVRLTHQLLLETSPFVILVIWSGIAEGVLNAYKRFALPAISPMVRGIAVIVVVFLLKNRWGVHSITCGYVVGELLRLVALVLSLRRMKEVRIRLSFGMDPQLRQFLKTSAYQTAGMLAVVFNPLVDKAMASSLAMGSVSVLHYADRINFIPVTVISTGLSITLLSHWSSTFYSSDRKTFATHVWKVVIVVTAITLPVMMILIIFRQPIVNLAFNHGAFDIARLPEISQVWSFYLLGFVPLILGNILGRAHLVMKKTGTLFLVAGTGSVLHILLNYVLMEHYGVRGIAISTAFTSLAVTLILMATFSKEMRSAAKRD